MAKTKKLSQSQIAALAKLSDGQADFYELMRIGASGPTTAWLVSFGLAKEVGNKSTRRLWEITDAGRVALSAGRVNVIGSQK